MNGDPLECKQGIEVGHIFKLGTKYSAAMDAVFMNENGKPEPFVMGCYGIGVSRVVAAAVEQYADERGIVWPVPLAPFEVAISCLKPKDGELLSAAESLYSDFLAAGADAMLDDRAVSPGVKFKDLELIGFPYAVIVGRDFKNSGQVEFRCRRTGEKRLMAGSEVVQVVMATLESERKGR